MAARTQSKRTARTTTRTAAPKKRAAAASVAAHAAAPTAPHGADRAVLIAPYLTEKSSVLAEIRQYTFLVRPDAEKVTVSRAIAQRYGVHPTRVRIVRTHGKLVQVGRTVGHRSGIKKAIVTLREGETIPFGVKT